MSAVKFAVAEYNDDVPEDMYLASVAMVRSNMDSVKECLDYSYEWHICALRGGTISGPGYNYEITDEEKELGHKLLVIKPEFVHDDVEYMVADDDSEPPSGWSKATIYDVVFNERKVHESLSGKTWHICCVVDGTVSGPGYYYEVGHENKGCGHKIICDRPSADDVAASTEEYPPVDFIITLSFDEGNDGYRLATRAEVEEYMYKLQETFDYRYEWHQCALADGTAKGSGYGYAVTDEIDERSHKILINRGPKRFTDFIIMEFNEEEPEGYRKAMRQDVEKYFDQVRDVFTMDYEWHICSLFDGTISGPGYGYEIKQDYEDKGHKLLINRPPIYDPLLHPPAEFMVAEYHEDVPGFRMALRREAEDFIDKVKDLLNYEYEWHICALVDGTIAGPGYNHELTDDVKELGHKLLINREPLPEADLPDADFCVEEYECCKDEGWRMASKADVKAYEDKVHQSLEGCDWHICSLVDGTVAGPGYSYEVTDTVTAKGHKLMISGGKAPAQPAFRVVPQDEDIGSGWRLARRGDFEHGQMDLVREEFENCDEDRAWHMCSLVDGVIKGPGYNYDIETEPNDGLGHKLMISY